VNWNFSISTVGCLNWIFFIPNCMCSLFLLHGFVGIELLCDVELIWKHFFVATLLSLLWLWNYQSCNVLSGLLSN
jgi:hypothetical protein